MAEKLEELHANGKKVWDYIKTPLSKEIKKTITYGLVFGGTISDIVYSVNQKYGLGTVNKEVVLDVLSYFLDLPEAIENYLANLSDIDFEVKNACGKKFKFDEEVKNKPNAKRIKKEATLQKETKEKKARKYLAFQAQGMEAFYMSKIIAEAVGNELFAFIYDGFMVDLPIVTDKETTAKNYTNNIEAYINKHFPGMHITSEIIKPN
jgi:hypothetical protein